jgi:hypothetical protein
MIFSYPKDTLKLGKLLLTLLHNPIHGCITNYIILFAYSQLITHQSMAKEYNFTCALFGGWALGIANINYC